MQSQAQSPDDYINSLSAERKEAVAALRDVILRNLPEGFSECMSSGMIGYVVPLNTYPKGYHCNPSQPLPFLCLASQKNYIALYHMGMYSGKLLEWFTTEWAKATPRKLDMGKSCIRFKNTKDIPLELIGKLAGKMTVQQWIGAYEQALEEKN